MGIEGLVELAKFVQEGGTLITEGSTATIFPEYGITTGVTVEEPAQLFVRGSILRAKITDMKSPIAYGYGSADLPVYFNQSPVLNAGGRRIRRLRRRRRARRRAGHEPQRRHRPERDAERAAAAHPAVRGGHDAAGRPRRASGCRRHGADAADGAQFGITIDETRPRVVMQFSAEPDRHAAVGHAGQRPVPRRTARRRSIIRSARGTS